MKCLVYGLYVLETAQTILATYDAFQWFAYGFGNMIALSKPFTSSIDAPIMDGILALVVQLFFSWRIYKLGKSWLLSGAISLVAMTQFVGGLVAGIRSVKINNVTMMRSSTVYLVVCHLILSNCIDNYTTVMLFLAMVRWKRPCRHTHRHCDDVLGKVHH